MTKIKTAADRTKGFAFSATHLPQIGDTVSLKQGINVEIATVSNISLSGMLSFSDRRNGWHLWSSEAMSACTLVTAVKAPAKEPTAPMQKAVLDLLRRKGAITSMEAQGVLRCRQLPARVLELKRLGHSIVTEMKLDHTGQKYARYHLQVA
ncbi:helix-turn-helix domain-containing protein [Mesorhizobium sp. M1403]|uniref:helix-turn-helix domain-containing protein n=1 Tax=Mesorhizobium sp. M1403 TaxID=2957097 RepID=UPI00333B3592